MVLGNKKSREENIQKEPSKTGVAHKGYAEQNQKNENNTKNTI